MTSDPRFRKVLVTDAKSPVGQAVVKAVLEAGADLVWAGHCEPWKNPPGWAICSNCRRTTLVPLDVTDTKSVNELAAELGFKVDIVINTAEHHRTYGLFGRTGVETARAEMETNCFGLLRLAQAFGPVMRARGADGVSSAVAWVNLLSIYALSNFRSTRPIRRRWPRHFRVSRRCAPKCARRHPGHQHLPRPDR